MKTRSFACSLSMNDFSGTHEPVGTMEVRVKERYQMVVHTRDGVEVVVADFKFPELKAEFSGAADQFIHPRQRQVHVLNILASLQLELRPFTLQQIAREMLSLMGELVELRGGNGFRMVLVVDLLKLDRDNNIDVIECGSIDDDEEEEEVEMEKEEEENDGEVIDDDEDGLY